jgi:hypothetical protein
VVGALRGSSAGCSFFAFNDPGSSRDFEGAIVVALCDPR